MRKLTLTLALPALLGLLGAPASAADEAKKTEKKTDAAAQLSEYFDRYLKPNETPVPKARRADVNLQSRGRMPVVPIVPWEETKPKGESTYAQGVLEQVEDGGLHIRYDVLNPQTGAKSKVTRWYRLANMKVLPKTVLDAKVGKLVRLELKKDANGVPFIMNVLTPR